MGDSEPTRQAVGKGVLVMGTGRHLALPAREAAQHLWHMMGGKYTSSTLPKPGQGFCSSVKCNWSVQEPLALLGAAAELCPEGREPHRRACAELKGEEK